MSDKVDLKGVERKLEKISNNLNHPFEKMDNERRHKEILNTQNKFYEKSLSKQSNLNKWTMILAIATILLCLFTMFMAVSTKKSVDLQIGLNSPKITTQITDGRYDFMFYYGQKYEHKVQERYLNHSEYKVPIFVEINNIGSSPVQIYNIQFESECHEKVKGIINLPENTTKVIRVGSNIKTSDEIYFPFNTTVEEHLPCNIYFTIYANNFVENKVMTLVKDK